MKYTIAVLWTFLLMLSCSGPTEQASGAQDFPNSMTVAMKSAHDVAGMHSEFEGYERVGNSLRDSLLQGKHQQEPDDTLGKRAATQAFDTSWWDYDDTASGTATFIRHTGDSSQYKYDTTVVLYDDAARDIFVGNERTISRNDLQVWPLYDFSISTRRQNTDTAGFYERGVVEYDFARTPEGRTRYIFYYRAGPDGSFEQWLDNVNDSSAILEYAGDDTLTWNWAADVDGNGALWSYGAIVPDTVLYHGIAFVDTTQPDLQRGEMWAFLQLHPYDLQRSIPLRFTYERLLETGFHEVFKGGGYRADSTAAPGEPAWITITQTMPPGDSISSAFLDLDVIMDQEPFLPDAQSKMTVYEADVRYRSGSVQKLELTFLADSPVVQGDSLLTGKLSVRFLFKQGFRTYFQGRIEKNRIRGEYEAEDNKTYTVRVEPDGTVVRE